MTVHPSYGLSLTVVGSGSAYARGAGRASSCYLVEHAGAAIVLDLGQGSFAALADLLPPESVLAVFISHLHPDHGVDLVALRHYLKYGLPTPGHVALHAPHDLRRRYDVLLGEEDFLADLPGDPVVPGERTVGPFIVTAARVTHTESSFGFRVAVAGAEHAPGLVYSGDCGRADDLLPLLRPGDTLLSEASFGDLARIPDVAHLTAVEAALAAREGRAARLVLTHLLDEADAETSLALAAGTFRGPVELARPGLRVPIR
ncbi:MBL fold metallo-hydrolase [soil metagenome]